MRFISSSFTISSSFFARQSGSESGSLVFSSYNINVIKDIGSLEPDFVNNRIEFIIPSQSAGGANDVKALTISASGINPRVGIGTNDPKGVFDFKDVGDTTTSFVKSTSYSIFSNFVESQEYYFKTFLYFWLIRNIV